MTQFKSNTNIDFGVYFARCCWKNGKNSQNQVLLFHFWGRANFGLKKGVRWDVWVLIPRPGVSQEISAVGISFAQLNRRESSIAVR